MTTGRRGPAPAPAEVRKAKGSGKRPIASAELEAEARAAGAAGAGGASSADSAPEGAGGGGGEATTPAAAVAAPAWLNADGMEVWNRLAARLATMRILQSVDAEAFGRYCQNFGRWVKLQKRLDIEGETYTSESPHGTYVRSHPAFMISDRLDRALERAEANFALNPADRQRLFAARAAAAGAGAGSGDLFGHPSAGGPAKPDGSTDAPAAPTRPVGFLNNGRRLDG